MRVCAVSDVAPSSHARFDVDGVPVCVVHLDDGWYAINDICSHANVSLSEGEVEDCTIECWLHGSRFDLRTGRPLNLPAYAPVDTFPVLVEDGLIKLEVD